MPVRRRPASAAAPFKVRWSIGGKLTGGFLCLMLASGTASVWSYQTLLRIQSRYENLVLDTYPTILSAKNLHAEILTQAQQVISFAATQDTRVVDSLHASSERTNQHLQALKQGGQGDPTVMKMIRDIEERRQVFDRMVTFSTSNAGSIDQYQLVLAADNARNTGDAVGKLVSDLTAYLQKQVQQAQADSKAATATATGLLMILGLVTISMGILISLLAHRMIARPLREMAMELGRIADGSGDLTQQLRVSSQDEIGLLSRNFNRLVTNLAGMVRQMGSASEEIYERISQVSAAITEVNDATTSVAHAMEQVSVGAENQTHSCQTASINLSELNMASDQIASGAQHQAARVQETTSAVQEVVLSLHQVASTASQLTSTSTTASQRAKEGASLVDETLNSMQRIQNRVEFASKSVQELGQYGSRIGEMLQVITEIAAQTNLLALNAAIEAARAGAHGRGFAVVAEEVRQLAERSANSVKEIRMLASNIQEGTRLVVSAIADTNRDVENTVQLSQTAGSGLDQILQAFSETAGGVKSIHDSIQSMLTAAKSVSNSIQEVAAITEENSASSEEMAAGVAQVARTMDELNQVSSGNSLAVGRVAASMDQVTSSFGVIQGSASELNAIAASLRTLVSQFKV